MTNNFVMENPTALAASGFADAVLPVRRLMEQRYSWSQVARDFEPQCREWLQ